MIRVCLFGVLQGYLGIMDNKLETITMGMILFLYWGTECDLCGLGPRPLPRVHSEHNTRFFSVCDSYVRPSKWNPYKCPSDATVLQRVYVYFHVNVGGCKDEPFMTRVSVSPGVSCCAQQQEKKPTYQRPRQLLNGYMAYGRLDQ